MKKKIIRKKSIRNKLGNSTRIKILEFLINNKNEGWGIREIIKYARVKHRTSVKEIKNLIKEDMIYIDRTIGRSNLFKVNDLDPFIQSLSFAVEIKNKVE